MADRGARTLLRSIRQWALLRSTQDLRKTAAWAARRDSTEYLGLTLVYRNLAAAEVHLFDSTLEWRAFNPVRAMVEATTMWRCLGWPLPSLHWGISAVHDA